MVKVNTISKYFGKEKAVDGLSFELKKREITGLLGANGAGKSTTMRMITSYLFPSKGTISINGLDTQKHTLETQRLIGYIPENNPLYTEMLVYDYLEMSARFFDSALADIKRIKETAKSVGLSDKLMTSIHELSKGYRQRVALAAALIHNPSVLIMDEPTEGLDPNQRQDIHRLIKSLSKDKAILISSHVLQEVKAMCTSVIVINKGRLAASGSLDSLSGYKTIKMQLE